MEEGALQQTPQAGLDPSSVAKKCTKCGIVKGRDGFYPGQCRFNLMSTCKECTKAKNNRLRKQALPVLAPDVLEKRCSRCKEMRPASAYFKSRGRASGLRSDCKECESAALRVRKEKKKSIESQSVAKKLNAATGVKEHSEGSVKLAKVKKSRAESHLWKGHANRFLCNLCKIRKAAEDFTPRSSEKSALLVCISCFEMTERQVELAK